MTPDERAQVLAELDRLEAASHERERQLMQLTDEVPAAVSRAALVRSLVGSARDLLPGRRQPR